MHKNPLFLLLLALLLWGCPTKDEQTPEPEKTCLLQKIERDIFSQRFTYNNLDQLIQISWDSAGVPFGDLHLTYDAKQRLVSMQSLRLLITYEYSEQNHLVKQTSSHKGATASNYILDYYYTFSYNSKNELEESRTYYVNSGSEQLIEIKKYSYTNGNPIEIEERAAGGELISKTILTYDTKKLPLPFWMLDFDFAKGPSLNNIASYQQTDRSGSVISYTIAYTYNAQGLPVVATTTFASGHKQTTTYSYNCR